MTKDDQRPSLLKNRVDLKGLTAGTMYDFIEDLKDRHSLENTKVVFYTTIGVVTGTWIPVEDDASKSDKDAERVHETLIDLRTNKLKQLIEENENINLINDTGSIPLINVTISPYGSISKHHLGSFLLFADQIVGITYGEERQQET